MNTNTVKKKTPVTVTHKDGHDAFDTASYEIGEEGELYVTHEHGETVYNVEAWHKVLIGVNTTHQSPRVVRTIRQPEVIDHDNA